MPSWSHHDHFVQFGLYGLTCSDLITLSCSKLPSCQSARRATNTLLKPQLFTAAALTDWSVACHVTSTIVQLHLVYVYSLSRSVTPVSILFLPGPRFGQSSMRAIHVCSTVLKVELDLKNVTALLLSLVLTLLFILCTLSCLLFAAAFVRYVFWWITGLNSSVLLRMMIQQHRHQHCSYQSLANAVQDPTILLSYFSDDFEEKFAKNMYIFKEKLIKNWQNMQLWA